MSDVVRLGIIGASSMGVYHAAYLKEGKVKRCRFTAICDTDERKLTPFSDVKTFPDSKQLIRSGEVDAVLIATPHYSHTTIGIDALEQGLHVLVEKPVSVHKADCRRLLAAHRDRSQVFAAMLNLRTDPRFRWIRDFIQKGELGEVYRLNWMITDIYRPDAYYLSAGWRGTWKGEGGGVLINQCPHHLDLLQWFCGMPTRVRAFCGLGSRHDIEVEDQVTAYMELPGGANAVFIASTCEWPGTNRLEIAGERGRLLLEDGKLSFIRNEVSLSEFTATTTEPFGKPEVWHTDIPVKGNGGPHHEITQNFVDAILDGAPLIAPAEEGCNSVELANAMLMSTLTDKTVDIPMDTDAFEREHARLIAESTFVKKPAPDIVADMSSSFRFK